MLDSHGKVLQTGQHPNFVVDDLDAQGVYGYYLQAIDEKGTPIETVAIAAFTSAIDHELSGFKTVMATPNVVKLEWHEMPGVSNYRVLRNGELLAETGDTALTDLEVPALPWNLSYAVEFVREEMEEGEIVESHYFWQITVESSRLTPPRGASLASSPGQAKIRLSSFIPACKFFYGGFWWLGDCRITDNGGAVFGYSYGNNQTNEPKYRTVQDIGLDFDLQINGYYRNVGTTTRCSLFNNCVTDRADMGNMRVGDFNWSSSSVDFRITLDAGNPLAAGDICSIDAILNITAYRSTGAFTGSTRVKGDHDGFPA